MGTFLLHGWPRLTKSPRLNHPQLNPGLAPGPTKEPRDQTPVCKPRTAVSPKRVYSPLHGEYIYITYHIVLYSTCTPSFVHAWLHDMSEEPTAWAMEWKRRAFMQVFPRTYPKSSKGTINFGTSASCWHNIDGYPNKRQIIRMPYAHMWYIKMHKRKHLESSPTLTVTLDAKKTTMPLS